MEKIGQHGIFLNARKQKQSNHEYPYNLIKLIKEEKNENAKDEENEGKKTLLQ